MPFNLTQLSSNMLRLKSRMPLIFRALALKYTHNFIHRGENQLCNRFEVSDAQAGSRAHTSRGTKGKLMHPLPTQDGKNIPLTWNTTRNGLRSCTKMHLLSTIPFVFLREVPSRSIKETSGPSPKGTGKDNSGTLLAQHTGVGD